MDIWYFKEKDTASTQNPVTFEMNRKEVACEPGNMLFKSKFAFDKNDDVCLKQGNKKIKLIPKLAKFQPNTNGDIDIVITEHSKSSSTIDPRQFNYSMAGYDYTTERNKAFGSSEPEDNTVILMDMTEDPSVDGVTFSMSNELRAQSEDSKTVLERDNLSDQDKKWLIAVFINKIKPGEKATLAKEALFGVGSFSRDAFIKAHLGSFFDKFYLRHNPYAGSVVLKSSPWTKSGKYIAVVRATGRQQPLNWWQKQMLYNYRKYGQVRYVESMFSSTKNLSKTLNSTRTGNRITFLVVGVVDLVQWLNQPEEQKRFADILVQLGVDYQFVMASGYASTFLAELMLIAYAKAFSISPTAKAKLVSSIVAIGAVSVIMILSDWDDDLIKETKIKLRKRIEEIERDNIKTDIMGTRYFIDPVTGLRRYDIPI